MKNFILFIYLFIYSISLCQDVRKDSSSILTYSKIRIGVELVAFRGLILNPENGPKLLKSNPLPSLIVSIGYPINFSGNWIVSMGASAGYAPVNLRYRSTDLMNHTVYNSGGDQYDLELNEFDAIYLGTGFVSLNLKVIKHLKFKSNNRFIIGGGFSIARGVRDFSNGGSFGQKEITIGTEDLSYKIFESYIDQDTISFPWKPVIQFSLGKKFGNYIEAYINMNYSLKPWFSGAYYFYNLGFSSNGVYRKDFSYIGLQMVYELPLKREEK